MSTRIIDAPIFPRPITVTSTHYDSANVFLECEPDTQELLDFLAQAFAVSEELSALRPFINLPVTA